MKRLRCRFGTGEVGPCFVDSDFVISRIDLDQQRSFLNELVITHIHFDHMTCNAGADGVEVNIHLSIVGRLEAREPSPKKDSAHNQQQSRQYKKNPERLRTPITRKSSGPPGWPSLWRSLSRRVFFTH